MPEILHKRPAECPETDLATFEALVEQGGEVASQGLRERILRAEWLVFTMEEDGTPSGIGALKKPNESYKREVFRKAVASAKPDDFQYEAGWLFVSPAFRGRGYSRLLLAEVIRLADKKNLYATTREYNEPMRRTNQRCGLVETGSPFAAKDGDYKLLLCIHQCQEGRTKNDVAGG